MITWTIAYRKPTANRFLRASDFAGTWAQAAELAGRFAEAHPELQVFYVPTKAMEDACKPEHEDNGTILTDTGRRVRMVEGGTIGDLEPVSEYEARQEFEWGGAVFVGERETECPAKYRAKHNLPPFVADPLNPTDDELAAAIDRGLADGSIIDSAEFLARTRARLAQDAQAGHDCGCGGADQDACAVANSFSVSVSDTDTAARREHDAAGPEHAAWSAGASTHATPAQPYDGHCRASGGYHKYTDVPRYTTSDGALLTLGGHVTCAHCRQLDHYTDLSADYREALRRDAGRTFPGNVSESFALYALDSYGIDATEARRMLYRASHGQGTVRAFEGEFVVSLAYAGNDPEAGLVFTVGGDIRTAGTI